ncbi:MAG: hypothetical protein K0U98_13590 [Deltaproteobacteria bacterium]|nr:hypothetical protein [Deltaproteobacteria bacterium]
MPRVKLTGRICFLAFLVWAAGNPAQAGKIEDALEAQWRGVFVVLKAESTSGCGDGYSNNPVFGARLGGRGEHSFGPGELGQVKKVDVKRNRVDLLVDVIEPLRISFEDGPFQLYRHARCGIELQFDIPRSALKKGGVSEADNHLSKVLERHEAQSTARDSALYNARQVDPFPEGYETVQAEYEQWKAEQVEVAVRDRLAGALDAASRIGDRTHSNQSYSEGFTSGLRYTGSYLVGSTDCYQLINSTLYVVAPSPPVASLEIDSAEWQAGHRDGQELAYYLDLARGLERCLS